MRDSALGHVLQFIEAFLSRLATYKPTAARCGVRWTRIAASANAFVINQFGLSCFRRLSEPGVDGEPRYLAATFNFYLFPRPADNVSSSRARAGGGG